MKKMIFSAAAFALVAVTGVMLAPTTASAIPAFARQTGAACLSCHFQEVPALAPFGRAFKMGSFTDVGDEALVEDDNLSIPAVLNATMQVRMNVQHTSGGGAISQTVYNIPTDAAFMVAGRVGSNTGAFVEFGGGAGDTGTAFNNFQLMNSWDVGGFKVGLGYADTAFGGSSVMEVSSVFGQHSGAVGDLGGNVGAINHSGFTNEMTQVGAWIGNDLGYIQVALVAPGGGAGWNSIAGTGTATAITADGGATVTQGANNVGLNLAKLIRGVATLNVGGFDTLVGFGYVGGKLTRASAGQVAPEMNLVFVDAQMQGDVGDMSLGIYADYAHAKGKPNGNVLGAQDVATNVGNANGNAMFGSFAALGRTQKFDAYSIRATLGVLPGITVGAGYGYRKTTDTRAPIDINGAAFSQPKHQVFSLSASYQLYMNSIISLNFTNDKISGVTAGSNLAGAGVLNGNLKTTTLDWLTLM